MSVAYGRLRRMYREWALGIDGAVIWTRDAETVQRSSRILPDGCIDLL